MRIAALICLFYLFPRQSLLAQSTWPPVYEIKADTATIERFDPMYFQRLEDKEGKWSFSDVSKPPLADKFHSRGVKADDIDTNAIHTYWHRYRLKNVMLSPAKISFASAVDYYDVFVKKKDSAWVQYKTGILRAWDQRDGLKVSPFGFIPLILMPGEEIEVYDRRERINDTNFVMNPHFRSTEKIIQKEYVDYVHNESQYYSALELTEAFLIGFLLVAFIYNLIFFRIVKEPVYLYFSLFLFFLSIMRLYNISDSYFQRESPFVRQYIPYLSFSWALIYFFLIFFIRHFFKTYARYKKWDKFLVVLSIVWLVLNMAGVFSRLYYPSAFPDILKVYKVVFVLIPLLLLVTLFLFVRHKHRYTRFVIMGAFPMLFLYGVLGWFTDDFNEPLPISFLKWLYGGNFRIMETLCVLWFVLFFSLILFIRYNAIRKENAQRQLDNERLAKEKEIERNELISRQKVELEKQVAERTTELEKSLEELRLSQKQLIQSEKMASLGELTAGIAHEIQNPLNFVNNFSDVNKELLLEMKDELDNGNIADAKTIANDVIDNEEKINHHGKRADAIVKGMLQHSRSSTGLKEPTDINKLADEYLRLAYHGLRAKDKTFNATLKTDFDETIGNINIIPQDIGRVILNLINNAFYAVDEKKKQQPTGYEPTVFVITKKAGDKVLISVKDNGNGIPQKVLDKIFQPFFTTKPTGEGTGLGLSLAYDIVKAHGGEIRVESKEGEGTNFKIELPV